AADVPAGKVHFLRIVGTTKSGTKECQAGASVAEAQVATFNGLTNPPPSLSRAGGVGIAPSPPFTLATGKTELVFGKGLSATVKVKIARADKSAEEVARAIALPAPRRQAQGAPPPPPALPPGITAAVKPISADATEVEIVYTATAQAPLGQFNAVLIGTGK